MSDSPKENPTQTDLARAKLVEALGEHADGYDYCVGGIITGYVAIYEVTTITGSRYCMWATGDGNAPDGNRNGGLDAWRVEGLLRRGIRDIVVGNVTRAIAAEEDE